MSVSGQHARADVPRKPTYGLFAYGRILPAENERVVRIIKPIINARFLAGSVIQVLVAVSTRWTAQIDSPDMRLVLVPSEPDVMERGKI